MKDILERLDKYHLTWIELTANCFVASFPLFILEEWAEPYYKVEWKATTRCYHIAFCDGSGIEMEEGQYADKGESMARASFDAANRIKAALRRLEKHIP